MIKNLLLILKCMLLLALLFLSVAFASSSDDDEICQLSIGKLEKVKDRFVKDKGDITDFPPDIIALQGKKVKIAGYLLIPYDAYSSGGSIDNFAVGKNPYGCPCCDWGSSMPPTIFNTVFVTMKKGESLTPPFTPLVEVTGTFAAHQEYYTDENGKKQIESLFFIQDAEARNKKQGFLESIF
ncbi:MAG: hypothetical protein WC316_02395 [Candidatus Omnitrophota bacterium]